MLFSMGFAGAGFRVARFGLLGQFEAAGLRSMIGGTGVRALANLGGLLAEGTTFTFAERGLRQSFGQPQDWSAHALGHDWLGGMIFMGCLRLAGLGSEQALRWSYGSDLATGLAPRLGGFAGLTQTVVRQGMSLGGIVLARGLEEKFGLREAQDGATLLTDSLVTLINLHIAGRLSGEMMGRDFQAWERSLDLRSEALSEGPPRGPSPFSKAADLWRRFSDLLPQRHWVTPDGSVLPESSEPDLLGETTVLMSSLKDGASGSGRGGRRAATADRKLALSPALRKLLRVHDARAVREVLEMIYTRTHGTLREEILTLMASVDMGRPLGSRLRQLLKDPRLEATRFISVTAQEAVFERIGQYEQEADVLSLAQSASLVGQLRPNVQAFRDLSLATGVSPREMALVLNRMFSPYVDLSAYVSFRGEPIYISNETDETTLQEYLRHGRQTLGEVLFFARKDLSRNWMLHEAARKLQTRGHTLQQFERNQRSPSLKLLIRFSEVYGLDLVQLKVLRRTMPRESTPPALPISVESIPEPVISVKEPELDSGPMEGEIARASLPPALLLSAQDDYQIRSERLNQLGMVLRRPDLYQMPIEEAFAEAVEIGEYFETLVSRTMHQAHRDLLTGLRNRAGLSHITEYLEDRLLNKRKGTTLLPSDWVLMIDIDFFKKVNDTYGHGNGDHVLRAVAQTIARAKRFREDIAVRYGGEEFFVHLRDSGRDGAERVAEKIRKAVEEESIVLEGFAPTKVTLSIGAAEIRPLPSPRGSSKLIVRGALKDSIDRADDSLYDAKESGRNRVVLSSK